MVDPAQSEPDVSGRPSAYSAALCIARALWPGVM